MEIRTDRCRLFRRAVCTSVLVVLCGTGAGVSAEETKDEGETQQRITYEEHILPIFRAKCFSCHNQDKKTADLNLTNHTDLMLGGSSGEVIEPGQPDDSWLYLLVTHAAEPNMPPKSEKLPEEEIEAIRRWILDGAPANASSKTNLPRKPRIEITLQGAPTSKPEGPPSMPEALTLEPVVRAPRGTAITAIASSPWAPLVAVAGQKQVLLYHSESLELLGVLPFPEGLAYSLKFSGNGSLLLAGGGRGAHSGRVVVWNVENGERVLELGDEYDSVLAADISSDQSMIALGGPSKVVRVYSTTDGELMYEVTKHTDWVYSLEFSPDSVLLATADRNGGMFVWEAYTGREYLSLRGHGGAITDVTWRDDSNVLASASEDGSVRLWEMESGGQIKNWGAHSGGVLSLEFTHDSRLVSCGRDRVVKVWDQNGSQQRAFEAFTDLALKTTFNHDGSRVIAGDWSGEVRVWNTADGNHVGNLSTNPPTIAERLEAAHAELAARQSEYDKLAESAAATQLEAEKASAGLATAQKAATDTATAAKAASEAVVKAKASAEKAASDVKAVTQSIVKKGAAAKVLAQAAAEVKKIADAEPGNQRLAGAVAKSTEARELAATDLAETRKRAEALSQASEEASKQHKASEATAQKAADDSADASKQVEALAPGSKKTAEQATAAKAEADKAEATLVAARATVEKWTSAAKLDESLKDLASRQSEYERLAQRAARAQANAEKAATELQVARAAVSAATEAVKSAAEAPPQTVSPAN